MGFRAWAQRRRATAVPASALLLVGGALIGSAGGLGFSRLVAARLDDPATSDIRAVLGGLSAVGFLGLGVQLAIVGTLGRDGPDRSGPTLERNPLLLWLALSVAVTSGGAAALAIDSSTTFRIESGIQVAIAVAAILLSCAPRAELLLRERWGRLGLLYIVGPIVRLAVAAFVLTADRPGLHVVPIVAGEVVTAVLAFGIRPRDHSLRQPVPVRPLIFGALASAGLLALIALSSVGLRSRLGGDAEVFNNSANSARVVGFLPLIVSMIYFPRLARSPIGSRELRRSFLAATTWTVGISGTAALVIVAAPSAVTELVAPSDQASVAVVRILAIAWAINAVSLVALFVYIAHASRFALAAWPIAMILGTGHLIAGSAHQLAAVALGCSGLLAIAVIGPVFLRVQPILHAQAATTPEHARPGDVTLVIPCFNPGPAVIETIVQAAEVLSRLSPSPAIIAVCDGSTDRSDELIDRLDLPMLQHVRHATNLGKGAALRAGFALARTEFVAFVDADGDLAPSQLDALLGAQQHFGADIVFGSKRDPASVVHASRLRRVYSAGYRRLILLLFQLDIEDTQTGIKLYRREVLDAVLPSLREDKFALDLEIFVAARAAGFDNFVGVPVTLRRESGSTISVRAILVMFTDTMRLFWRTKVTLAYVKSAIRPEATNRSGTHVL